MLTPDQIQTFRNRGYLVVENALDQSTVLDPVRHDYAALLDDLYAGWQADGRVGESSSPDFWGKLLTAYRAGCDWFQPMDISLPASRIEADTPMHFSRPVFDMVTNSRLLDIVESLIGPEITSNPIQHVRIKPPVDDLRADEIRAHVTRTDWHQDRAVALEEADNTTMVTVWIAVTDATVENGCLKVLPKAGDQTMLPHCPKTQTAIADGFVDEAQAVPILVKSGGIVLLDPMTPHASLPNTTDGFRWSFDLRYSVTGQPTGRAFFPDFIARSRSSPAAVLTDWREWRSMWEERRAQLATNPHINIHRWTSDAPFCA